MKREAKPIAEAAVVAALVALAAGCGAGAGAPVRSASHELGASPVCAALPALEDLRKALTTTSMIGASSEVGYVVDADQEIGRIHVTRKRLVTLGGADAKALDTELAQLASSLEARRGRLEAAVTALRASRETLDDALEATSHCGEIDLRAARSEASKAPASCEAAARLWKSARSVSVASADACVSMASHLGELRMSGEVGVARDDLAKALRRHADALQALERAAMGRDEEGSASSERLVRQRSRTMEQLEGARSQCLATMRSTDRVIGEAVEPRRATVTVRPTWGELDTLPGAPRGAFGSGFVVRWRNTSGAIETRVVTNAHVMMGAFDAEIVSGDQASHHGTGHDARRKAPRGWKATLVTADPVEDIAILRVEPAAGAALQGGLPFRMEPAVEQELVTAAGFPGVGVRPSFQVSKGTVSNAAFGADDRAKSAEAFVQHTAPVDSGNSGGPLLDGAGRLMGMTTFKLVHRENVALAVPTPRIQLAMLRAEEGPTLDLRDAEAACNAVAAALAVDSPHPEAMAAFGVALFDAAEAGKVEAARWRNEVGGETRNPIDEARRRAYGAVRAEVEARGGVRPYEMCTDVRAIDERFTSAPRFTATLRTRRGTQRLGFAEEHGAVRLVKVE